MRSRNRAKIFQMAMICGVLAASVAWPGAARADEWSKKYTISGKPEVRIETNDGNVRVDAWDGKEIEARVETMGWKLADSEVRVVERQTGNRVELEVRVPNHWHWGWHGERHWVKIELKIPREAGLDIQTKDGHINVTGVKGEMRLSSGDGNIEASGLDGRLNASSGDGHIRIEGRFDQLDLHTGDGHIEARVLPGSKMAASWNVKTGDGHVTLRLPGDFPADLDLHTGDGRISSDFPTTVSGTINRTSLRGKINGGGFTLMVHTGDGSIRLERL